MTYFADITLKDELFHQFQKLQKFKLLISGEQQALIALARPEQRVSNELRKTCARQGLSIVTPTDKLFLITEARKLEGSSIYKGRTVNIERFSPFFQNVEVFEDPNPQNLWGWKLVAPQDTQVATENLIITP